MVSLEKGIGITGRENRPMYVYCNKKFTLQKKKDCKQSDNIPYLYPVAYALRGSSMTIIYNF